MMDESFVTYERLVASMNFIKQAKRPLLISSLLSVALTALVLIVSYLLLQDGADTTVKAGNHDDRDRAIVRISAMKTESGAVHVAAQSQLEDGEWSDRVLPTLRVVPADARPGRWLNSSPIELPIPARGDELAAAETAEEPRRICLITHEQPGDAAFWNLARNAAAVITRETGVQVDYHAEPAPGGQASRVRQCVDSGVDGIVLTLPNLDDDLHDAINHAHDHFVVISTFNSGVRDFAKINSNVHVSIDEFSAGRDLGARLTAQGVTGDALCVIHEEANVALQERCGGVEQGYEGGTIERLSVAEFGVNDLDSVGDKILQRLRDDENPVSVLVALNHNVTLAAVDAAKEFDGELNIAGFDYNVPVLEAIDRGEVLMAVQQNLLRQASSAMFVTLTRFGLTDRMAAVGVNVRELIQPVLLTVEAKFIDSSNVGETINLFRALPRLAQRNLEEASK